MSDINIPTLSNANAVASTKGVINTYDPRQTIASAKKSAVKPYCGSGRMKRNGTVDISAALGGKSRFDK
jgi:hypothetical protein